MGLVVCLHQGDVRSQRIVMVVVGRGGVACLTADWGQPRCNGGCLSHLVQADQDTGVFRTDPVADRHFLPPQVRFHYPRRSLKSGSAASTCEGLQEHN